MPIVNFSPLTAVAVGPAGPPSKLSVGPHSSPSVAIAITAKGTVTENDFQWVLVGLTVPSRTKIKRVIVCYQVLGSERTYISQVRLTEMTTPDVALVKHDDGTNLRSTTPTCYQSAVANFVANGTVTLALKIVIGRSRDKILVGRIALVS